MIKHTKEKWQYNENFNWKTHPFSITARKRGVHSAVIANIPVRATIPPEEQMANARLIAAAPDLLWALEKMLREHDALQLAENKTNDRWAAATYARATIAKVRGE